MAKQVQNNNKDQKNDRNNPQWSDPVPFIEMLTDKEYSTLKTGKAVSLDVDDMGPFWLLGIPYDEGTLDYLLGWDFYSPKKGVNIAWPVKMPGSKRNCRVRMEGWEIMDMEVGSPNMYVFFTNHDLDKKEMEERWGFNCYWPTWKGNGWGETTDDTPIYQVRIHDKGISVRDSGKTWKDLKPAPPEPTVQTAPKRGGSARGGTPARGQGQQQPPLRGENRGGNRGGGRDETRGTGRGGSEQRGANVRGTSPKGVSRVAKEVFETPIAAAMRVAGLNKEMPEPEEIVLPVGKAEYDDNDDLFVPCPFGCGAENVKNMRFCPECGRPTGWDPDKKPVRQEKPVVQTAPQRGSRGKGKSDLAKLAAPPKPKAQPKTVDQEALTVAQKWIADVGAEKAVEMAEALGKMGKPILAAIEQLTAEPVVETPYYPEPEMIIPEGAFILGRDLIDGADFVLVRESTMATTTAERLAWLALQEGRTLPEVAGAWIEGGQNLVTALAKLAELLADSGTERVLYAIMSEPSTSEPFNGRESMAWHQIQEGADVEEVVRTLMSDGETSQAEALADYGQISAWPIRNVPVLPRRVEPDIEEVPSGFNFLAWQAMLNSDLTGAMAELKNLSTAEAAALMAQLSVIPEKWTTYELTVEEAKLVLGITEKPKQEVPVAKKANAAVVEASKGDKAEPFEWMTNSGQASKLALALGLPTNNTPEVYDASGRPPGQMLSDGKAYRALEALAREGVTVDEIRKAGPNGLASLRGLGKAQSLQRALKEFMLIAAELAKKAKVEEPAVKVEPKAASDQGWVDEAKALSGREITVFDLRAFAKAYEVEVGAKDPKAKIAEKIAKAKFSAADVLEYLEQAKAK